jgi:rod shape-determining protein MreC
MVETRGGRRFAVFFLVAAFLVLFLGRWLRPVDDVTSTVAAPFVAVVSGATSAVGDTISEVLEAGRLRHENQVLSQQNARLIRELITYKSEAHDNTLYRAMLRFAGQNSHMDLMPAQVIGGDTLGLGGYIIVNRGRSDGLRDGMTVLDQNGYFVGSISDLESNNAKVLLMESPSSSIDALDLSTRAHGIVNGRYAGIPQLKYVRTGDVLHVNDLIVTSGQMNLFPRNLLLGQVTRVYHRKVAVFQTADVRPAADIQHLEMVQIVRNWNPQVPTKLVTSH